MSSMRMRQGRQLLSDCHKNCVQKLSGERHDGCSGCGPAPMQRCSRGRGHDGRERAAQSMPEDDDNPRPSERQPSVCWERRSRRILVPTGSAFYRRPDLIEDRALRVRPQMIGRSCGIARAGIARAGIATPFHERERGSWVLWRCSDFPWHAGKVAASENPKSPPQNPAVRAYGSPRSPHSFLRSFPPYSAALT